MRCPSCGLENADKSNFCVHCGAPLNAQGQMQQVAAAAAPPGVVPAGTGPGTAVAAVAASASQPEKTLWSEYPSMRTALPPLALSFLILCVFLALIHVLFGGQHVLGESAQKVALIVCGIVFVFIFFKHLIKLRS